MMDAQEWLSRGIHIQKEIDALRRAREIAFTKATKETFVPKEVNVQTGRKTSNEHEFAKYADYGTMLNECLMALENVRCEIFEAIQTLPDRTQRIVLVYRYLNGLSWEDISELIDVSEKWTREKIHEEAVKKIAKYLKKLP